MDVIKYGCFGISKLKLKVLVVRHLTFGKLKLKLKLSSFTTKTNTNTKSLALTKTKTKLKVLTLLLVLVHSHIHLLNVCTPASTDTVEWIFSTGGEVTSGRCDRLIDSNLEREILTKLTKTRTKTKLHFLLKLTLILTLFSLPKQHCN